MSSKLSSVLARTGAVPVPLVEEAIQRQVIYGGSLGTNLLEMAALSEAELDQALAAASGLPAADAELITGYDPEAHKLFPRRMVERFRMVPAARRDGSLVLLVPEEAPDAETLKELSYMLGLGLELQVVSELRYVQALDLQLSIPMRPRFRNLQRKLDAGQAVRGIDQRSLTEEQRLEHGGGWSVGPVGGRRSATGSGRPAASTTSPPEPALSPLAVDLIGPVAAGAAPDEAALAAGLPATVSMITLAVGAAEAKAVVQAAQAEVEAARAEAPAVAPASAVAVAAPAVAQPVAEAAPVPARAPELAPAAPRGPNLAAARRSLASGEAIVLDLQSASERLEREGERDSLVRVALAYFSSVADHIYALVSKRGVLRGYLGHSRGQGDLAELRTLALDFVPGSLLHQVWSQGRHHLGPGRRDDMLQRFYRMLGRRTPDEVLVLPVVLGGRSAMVFVLDRDATSPWSAERVPELLVFCQRLAAALERIILERKSTPEPNVLAPPSAPARAPHLDSPLPRPAPFRSLSDVDLPSLSEVDLPSVGDVDLPSLTEPEVPMSAGMARRSRAAEGDWELVITPPEGVALPSQLLDEALAGAPAAAQEPLVTPAIVDPPPGAPSASAPAADAAAELLPVERRSLSQLVALLGVEATRDGAADALRALGVEHLEELMRHFPGPIVVDRESLVPGRYVPVEDQGPLLRLLVEAGAAALPRLRAELDSPVIANRFYATQLVARLVGKGEVALVCERMFDSVRLVRQAALEVLGQRAAEPEFAEIVGCVLRELSSTEGTPEMLRWAAEAAGTFRATEALEPLVDQLKHRDPHVQLAVHQALRDITRHDLGQSQRAWRRWLKRNLGRDRLEWLIDALVQDDLDLAERAAQELHRLTGQRIPLDVNGPRKGWKRAQAEWQAWYQGRR